MPIEAPPIHPGVYVKENILPQGMSVTRAAKILAIGRPALSNFINGKANLSQSMATRLEKAFDADKVGLLTLQKEYDIYAHRDAEKKIAVRSYTSLPPFLKITAVQIDAWADRHEARSLLPVLIRRLVNTTGAEITSSDFPAYDNSQRHGWDGVVESNNAIPWVPSGVSKWEFGCNQAPTSKASGDYTTRTKNIPKEEREKTTFIFVTPRNWPKKNEWAQAKKENKEWKDVLVFDANDLEQWLELSVPAQVWLAEQIGISTNDCLSLDDYWHLWSYTAKPAISRKIFTSAIRDHNETIQNWFKSESRKPLIITAASKEEAMAFLCCATDQVEELNKLKEQALLISSANTMRQLAKRSAEFIPIVYTDEAQYELVSHFSNRLSIIIPEGNSKGIDADISLDLPNYESFNNALKDMGFDDAEIEVYSNQSGKSPTILRRQLSEVPALRSPSWASILDRVRTMIPLVLAGTWKSDQEADKEILQLLAKCSYDDIEKNIAELASLDDSPIWSEGKYRGVVSELDCLYAISDYLTEEDLENFLFVAQYVLSEDDPSLDLKKENRWAANIYNKVRDHSKAVRNSLCQNIIILAVHGNGLFGQRLGINIENKISYLIQELLKNQNSRVWHAQQHDLLKYAEAAPDIFLSIIEEELKKEIPAFKTLFESTDSGIFSQCERTGMLWALELLAWNPVYLSRVIKILGELSTYELDDNWSNKPVSSLNDILLIWRPHTAASIEQICDVLELLCKEYPEIGWGICIKPLKRGTSVTSGTQKPSYRNYASGAGHTVTGVVANQFAVKCLDLVLAWPQHTKETLKDLIDCLIRIEEKDRQKIAVIIKNWFNTSPCDEDIIDLREHIRTSTLTTRAQKRNKSHKNNYVNGKELYDFLEPNDPLVKYQWLFAKTWVEYTPEELEEDDFDHDAREEKLAQQRLEALKEILKSHGVDGLIKLISKSGATAQIGAHLYNDLFKKDKIPEFIVQCLLENPEPNYEFDGCISGITFQMIDSEREELINNLVIKLSSKDNDIELIRRLFVNAQFDRVVWNLLELQSDDIKNKYWSSIYPGWSKLSSDDINFAVESLLDVNRPCAALDLAHYKVKLIKSEFLIRMLNEIAINTTENNDRYKPSQYKIEEALKVLNERSDFDRMKLVQLEYLYIDILHSHSDYGIPNLSKEIATSPLFFFQIIACCFKRDDDGNDPEEWNIPQDREARGKNSINSYQILQSINLIPGSQQDGGINVDELRDWIVQVRALAKEQARLAITDQQIGKLLSTVAEGDDGIWPRKEIRIIFEEIGSVEISTGMEIGLHNSGGAEFRSVDSSRERSNAQLYKEMADKVMNKTPFVGKMLLNIAKSYNRDAEWWDEDARVDKRLRGW